jgi:hypothetical protein
MEKMCKRFNTIAIIEDTNEISRQAAVDLWRKHELQLYNQTREERNEENIQSYNRLMEKLSSLFSMNSL